MWKPNVTLSSSLFDCWSFVWPIEPWSGIWYRTLSFPFLLLHCIVDLLIWRPWFSSFDLDQTHPRSINEQLRRESATGFGLDTYGIGIRQDWAGGVDLGFHLTLLHRHLWNITWNWIWIRLMDFDGGGAVKYTFVSLRNNSYAILVY